MPRFAQINIPFKTGLLSFVKKENLGSPVFLPYRVSRCIDIDVGTYPFMGHKFVGMEAILKERNAHTYLRFFKPSSITTCMYKKDNFEILFGGIYN